jgi:hypothetical protein
MANKYTIRLESNSSHDQLVMKSILGIIGQRACGNWSYVEGNSDVVVVDTDKKYPDIATLKNNNNCQVVVSYSETSRYIPQMNFSLSKPIRAKDLLVLLNEIEKVLAGPAQTISSNSMQAPAVIPSVQKAITSTKVLDQLLALTKQHKDTILEVSLDNQSLYLDNHRKKVFVNGQFVVSKLTEGQVLYRVADKVPFSALESLTFTDIFYELTLSQSSVSLAKDLSADDEFTIKQWPNMGNSRHAKSMIRTAAYFSKQKATVSKAARDLALEINHVIGFINAVHSQNLLVSYPVMASSMATPSLSAFEQSTSQPSPEPVQAKTSSGLGGLFGRIRQKLGL